MGIRFLKRFVEKTLCGGFMRKADLILCLCVLTLGFAIYLLPNRQAVNPTIKITCENKIVLEKALRSLPERFTLNTSSGIFVMQKTADSVRIISAPCPDKLCSKQGSIDSLNQSIVCVPGKLLITLLSAKEGDNYDAIAR